MYKLDHIGIAVKNIEYAMSFYQGALGLTPSFEEVIALKVRIAKLPIENTMLELIEPLPGEETIKTFLEKRGEGIHHLCLSVPDIRKAAIELTQKGYKPLYNEPKIGAGGHQVNFLHPKDTRGVLIELAEIKS